MSGLTMRVARAADGTLCHVPTPYVAPAPKGKKKRVPPDPIKTNGESAAEQLRLIIERLERLFEERAGINDDIRDVMSEAKSTGFDGKGINAILALRKTEKHLRDEFDGIIETYRSALGLL